MGRARVDEDRTRHQRRSHITGTVENLFHHISVGQRQDDPFAVPAHSRHILRQSDARARGCIQRYDVAVVGHHGNTVADQIRHHAATHGAKADESHVVHVVHSIDY